MATGTGTPSRQEHFVRDEVAPSWWANRIQDRLAATIGNFRLRRVNATTIEVPAGAADLMASLNVDKNWRFVEAAVQRAHPGGGAGTYIVYATAKAQAIAQSPAPNTDNTDYAFGLSIVFSPGTPAIVAGTVDVFRRVGSLTWDGAAITSLTTEVGAVHGSQVDPDFWEGSGPVTATRQPGGGWLLTIDDLEVLNADLADNAVDARTIAADAVGISEVNPDVELSLSDGKQEGVTASGDGKVTWLTTSSVRVAAGVAWVKGDGVSGFNAYYRVSWAQTDITGIPFPGSGQERVDTFTIPLPAAGAGTAVPARRAGVSVATQASFDAAITASFPDVNLPAGELRLANGWLGNTGLGSQANIRDRRTFFEGNDFEKAGGAGNPLSNTAAMTDVTNTGVWGTAPLAALFLEVGESGLVEVTLNSNFTKGGTADTAITENVQGRIYIDDVAAGRNFYQDHHRAGRWQNHCSSEKFALASGRHKFSFGLTGGAGFTATVWAGADTRLRVAEVLSPGADAA